MKLRKILITFILIISSVLCLFVFTSTRYGGRTLREIGCYGEKVANLNWCVFACLETVRRNDYPMARQCDYATDYARNFYDMYRKHNCCDPFRHYTEEEDYPEDVNVAVNCWLFGCFNGVDPDHIETFLCGYDPMIYIGELDDYLLSHKYVNMDIFPSYVIVFGHCVILTGFESDDTYAGDGSNILYYWDSDYNSMRSEIFSWKVRLNPMMYAYARKG